MKFHVNRVNLFDRLNSLPALGPFDNVVGSPAPVVLLGVALAPGGEVFDGRVALHAVLAGQALVDRGVDGAQFDLALQLAGGLLPVRLEVLAVSAPRGEELDL